MAWIEVFFEAPLKSQPLYEAWLEAHGALAVTYSYVDDETAQLWELKPNSTPQAHAQIIGLFEDTPEVHAHIAAMQAEHPERQLQTRILPETDWLGACQRDFPARPFGKRLWVCPSWENPPDPTACVLRLDPGLAFGTGAHPTTRLCLEVLDEAVSKDMQILDYGCGSGILALAACVLGAKHAWAIDHCDQALTSTRANAEENGLADRIATGLPGSLALSFQADIVCANILAGPLCELAPILWQHTRPGGLLILSGFLANQLPQLEVTYIPQAADFSVRWDNEWGCALLHKKG